MPRLPRVAVGDTVYHVLNRSNGKTKIFSSEQEYAHFESLLQEGKELTGMRILAYCVMPNHWHLVLYPKNDRDLSEFMRWVTTTHVRQRRVQTKSIGHGHLYQGTYKSFPVETDKHLVDLIRYVEQNPLRARLVRRAEDWKWSSLYRRMRNMPKDKKLLDRLPTVLPSNYKESVNDLLSKEIVETVRHSITKGLPYGGEAWVQSVVREYNLQSSTRGPGRPKKY
jgi:putative transposase